MSDRVAMTAKTMFFNTRIRSDRDGLVEAGDRFETDVAHARDLARLGFATPAEGALDGREDPPLAPHHQVSETALRADRQRRRAAATDDAAA